MTRLVAILSRSSRVLYALWLVVAMTQPAGAHACPLHDRALVRAMAARGMTMHHADAKSPRRHAPEQCHCLGDRCTGMATPLPSVRAAISVPPAILAELASIALVEQPFESAARLLPPATAPPTALVA